MLRGLLRGLRVPAQHRWPRPQRTPAGPQARGTPALPNGPRCPTWAGNAVSRAAYTEGAAVANAIAAGAPRARGLGSLTPGALAPRCPGQQTQWREGIWRPWPRERWGEQPWR